MSFFQRLREVLGLDDLYDDYYYENEGGMYPELYGDSADADPKPGLPSLPPGQSGMILLQPQSFDEMPDAVTALRQRRSVILDLSLIDVEHAQRCADYVAGGAFAIDGHYRQLGHNVFLFTPPTVHISHQVSEDIPEMSVTPTKPEPKPKSETGRSPRRQPIADPSVM